MIIMSIGYSNIALPSRCYWNWSRACEEAVYPVGRRFGQSLISQGDLDGQLERTARTTQTVLAGLLWHYPLLSVAINAEYLVWRIV